MSKRDRRSFRPSLVQLLLQAEKSPSILTAPVGQTCFASFYHLTLFGSSLICIDPPVSNILLLSNSTQPRRIYLDHAETEICEFLGSR